MHILQGVCQLLSFSALILKKTLNVKQKNNWKGKISEKTTLVGEIDCQVVKLQVTLWELSLFSWSLIGPIFRIQISLGLVHVLSKATIQVWLLQGQGTAGRMLGGICELQKTIRILWAPGPLPVFTATIMNFMPRAAKFKTNTPYLTNI